MVGSNGVQIRLKERFGLGLACQAFSNIKARAIWGSMSDMAAQTTQEVQYSPPTDNGGRAAAQAYEW